MKMKYKTWLKEEDWMKDIIQENCYIMYYPGNWGMGSDTECYFITETDLKRLITMELKKMKDGKSYSERLAGTWIGENCMKDSLEETISCVINKRLNTKSTYAGYNDLIQIPSDVKITKKEDIMDKKIFRIFNQFGYERDVIARKTKFIRYYVDLTSHKGFADLDGGKVYEFTRFEMEGILMFHFDEMDEIDNALECNYDKIHRLTAKRKGKKVGNQIYLSDNLEGTDVYEAYLDKWIEEAQWIVKHLEEVKVVMQDNYLDYLYHQEWPDEYFEGMFQDSIKNDKRDHTQCIYYALFPYDIMGCNVSGYEEGRKVHRYDELFQSECNVEYLLGIRTNSYPASSMQKVDVFNALRDVFGFD